MIAIDALAATLTILIFLGIGVYTLFYAWKSKEQRKEINRQVIGILKSRYASGEIGREEFDEIRREIERV